jgi:hypothetical protein
MLLLVLSAWLLTAGVVQPYSGAGAVRAEGAQAGLELCSAALAGEQLRKGVEGGAGVEMPLAVQRHPD